MTSAARGDAIRCALTAIDAVDPYMLVRDAVARHALGDRVSVLAVGKGAERMARAALDTLGARISRAVVVAPQIARISDSRVETYRGGHPIPTDESVRAAEATVEMIGALRPTDELLALISGGASSLLACPPAGVSLGDVRTVTQLLMASGAGIDDLNCLRKHLDRLKGGRLAVRAYPSRVLALVLSDVVGDSLATIASGPTVADPTTSADAIRVLRARGVWERTPTSVRAYLEDARSESPKPGDERLTRSTAEVIGSNTLAARAACDCARAGGYAARIVTTAMHGEARDVGAAIARQLLEEGARTGAPVALIFGGETTVTVTGSGRGGRNQELVLAAAIALRGERDVAVASIGTDGVDGPTDVAGAVCDGDTIARALAKGLDAAAALRDNDSYAFWRALGDGIDTGPTGTNVMDIVVALALPATA